MGKKSKRHKKSASSNPLLSSFEIRRKQAPVEPGREALIQGLVNRNDLNALSGTIQKILPNGRVAVEIIKLRGTKFEQREVVAIQRENLDVQWNSADNLGGKGVCPFCMDTEMNTAMDNNKNASLFACCGGAMCEECFIAYQSTEQRGVCPLCRAVTSDDSDAAEFAKIAARAKRGCRNAMYNLAGWYDYGLYGVARDQAAARVWYRKAAEKGEERAAHNLACSYRDGEGGPVDKPLAAKYFRVAADGGHPVAATNLGIAYRVGDGVERDLEEAKRWLTKGANAGHELAVKELWVLDQDRMRGWRM